MEGPGLILPGAVNPYPFIMTFDPSLFSWSNSAVPVADTLYVKYIGRLSVAVPVANFKCNIGTSAGNLNLLVFSVASNGDLTKLAETGSVASPGTGVRTIAAASAVTIPAGVDLALGAVGSDGTLTLARTLASGASLANVSNLLASKASVTTTVTSPVTGMGSGTYCPFVWAG
jgi:hypothetical protein